MLYIQTWERKELGKMYKVLKDIPYYKRVSAGDVVISCLAEEDRAYPRSDEEREWFFEFTKDTLGDRFNEWFEEIDEAYYYDNKTKQVKSIGIKDAFDMNRGEEHKYCFADEDKALEILEEEQNTNLPKNLEFKTVISSYIPNLGNNPQYSPEPLEIRFEETKFLLAIDWYRNNIEELKEFVSKEVFNSYVEKIWLNQEDNRIGITLTSSKYRS